MAVRSAQTHRCTAPIHRTVRQIALRYSHQLRFRFIRVQTGVLVLACRRLRRLLAERAVLGACTAVGAVRCRAAVQAAVHRTGRRAVQQFGIVAAIGAAQ